MTADDVKYSFERLVKMKSARVMFHLRSGVQGPLRREARQWPESKSSTNNGAVHARHPLRAVPRRADLTSFGVVKRTPRSSGRTFNFSPWAPPPSPFRKEQDNVVSFRKNPDYWRKDAAGGQLPYLDGVDLVIMPDYGVAYMELKKGNLHVLEEVTRVLRGREEGIRQGLPGGPRFRTTTTDSARSARRSRTISSSAGDQLRRRPQGDQPKCSSTDATCRHGGSAPGMSSYDPNLRGYEYNPEKAKQLLKEAGYEKGLEITLHYNSTPRHKAIAEAVQAQLGQFNITVKLASTEVGAHYDAVRRGDCEFFRAGWAGDYNDPDNFLYTLFCSDNFGAKGNYCRYKNDTVDTLLRDARKEPDPAKRVEMYKKAEQQIVDDAVWLFLYYQTTSFVSAPRFGHQTPFLAHT
jgi:peptide/nickel transport system substrate-binding protein/oligopeptide transport system substrate-binding protein